MRYSPRHDSSREQSDSPCHDSSLERLVWISRSMTSPHIRESRILPPPIRSSSEFAPGGVLVGGANDPASPELMDNDDEQASTGSRTPLTPSEPPQDSLPPIESLMIASDECESRRAPVSRPQYVASHIGYWSTSSPRSSRQPFIASPVFRDPFLEDPSRRSRIEHRPEPLPVGSYTTNSGHRSDSTILHPHRGSSLRSDFEPRLPSVFDVPSTRPFGTSSSATPPFVAQNGFPRRDSSIAGPSSMVPRRTSEIQYQPDHGSSYAPRREQYRQPAPYQMPDAQYPQFPARHDSAATAYSQFQETSAHYPYPSPTYHGSTNHVYHTVQGPNYRRRRRGNLPKAATNLMKRWFAEHAESPYPTEEEKNQMAITTRLQPAQISNWFINARRRNPGREARRRVQAATRAAQQQQQQPQDDLTLPPPSPSATSTDDDQSASP